MKKTKRITVPALREQSGVPHMLTILLCKDCTIRSAAGYECTVLSQVEGETRLQLPAGTVYNIKSEWLENA